MASSPIRPINLAEKLAAIADHWNPRIVAELNGQEVRLAKLSGSFVWHHHAEADELFLVVSGRLRMGLRDGEGERWVEVHPGEMIVIPRGIEHCPQAEQEVGILLFEPAGTLNTGNATGDPRTRPRLERI